MAIAIAALVAYAVGGIPFGYLVPKLVRGIDVRTQGSGNIGATNVGRVMGRRWGLFVFALDAAKGFVPAFVFAKHVAFHLQGDVVSCQVAAGLGAILGHMFPAALRFKGGKGVATSAGVFLGLAPLATGCAIAAWAVALATTRYVSLASIVGAVVLPAAMVVRDREEALGAGRPILILCSVASLLVVLRHRANVKRLLAGTEPKIGRKKEEVHSP